MDCVIEDKGFHDGVKKILFAYGAQEHWANGMLLMDAINHLKGSKSKFRCRL